MNINEIIIEKGIPLPPIRPVGNRYGRWVDIVRQMEIGDSVVLPRKVLGSIYAACRRHGWKVRIQTQPDGATLRLWRVAKESQ